MIELTPCIHKEESKIKKTIEENVAILKEHLNILNVDKGVEFYQEIESIQLAIDIMHKYQKIQEIFYRYDKGELTHDMFGLFVGEVLEDGNDSK